MRACPACGASNSPGDDFCGNCGAYLGWSDDPPAASTPSATSPEPERSEPERSEPQPSTPSQPPAAPDPAPAPASSTADASTSAAPPRTSSLRSRLTGRTRSEAGGPSATRAPAAHSGADERPDARPGQDDTTSPPPQAGPADARTEPSIPGHRPASGDEETPEPAETPRTAEAREAPPTTPPVPTTPAPTAAPVSAGSGAADGSATVVSRATDEPATAVSRTGDGPAPDVSVAPPRPPQPPAATPPHPTAPPPSTRDAPGPRPPAAPEAPAPEPIVAVQPAKPQAPRPVVRPAAVTEEVEGRPCPSCGTPNQPDRRFCRRCATPLKPTAKADPLPWWRTVWPFRRRVRASSGRGVRLLVILAVVLALCAGAVLLLPAGRALFEDTRDKLSDPKPVTPARTRASAEVPGHPAKNTTDGLANRYWGAPAPGASVTYTFDKPFRMVDLLITNGASKAPEEYAREGRALQIDLEVTTQDGERHDKRLTLSDKPGSQPFPTGISDVKTVRLVLRSATGLAPGRHLALAEVEFFQRS